MAKAKPLLLLGVFEGVFCDGDSDFGELVANIQISFSGRKKMTG